MMMKKKKTRTNHTKRQTKRALVLLFVVLCSHCGVSWGWFPTITTTTTTTKTTRSRSVWSTGFSNNRNNKPRLATTTQLFISASSFDDFFPASDRNNDQQYHSLDKQVVKEWLDDYRDSVEQEAERERVLQTQFQTRRARQQQQRATTTEDGTTIRVTVPILDVKDYLVVDLRNHLQLDLDDLTVFPLNEETRAALLEKEELCGVPFVGDQHKNDTTTTNRGLRLVVKQHDNHNHNGTIATGDTLVGVSATLGQSVWNVGTLEGVRSAVSSRRLTSQSLTLQIVKQQPVLAEEEKESATSLSTTMSTTTTTTTTNSYELTLHRPLGFSIGTDSDGFCVVTGISDRAPNLVRYAIAVGDRVVAVDTSMSNTLWPTSTVEGTIAAVTGRLPGQPVTMRFERQSSPDDLRQNQQQQQSTDTTTLASTSTVPPSTTLTTTKTKTTTKPQGAAVVPPSTNTPKQKDLLRRCRSVLQKYSTIDTIASNTADNSDNNKKSMETKLKFAGAVADKVVESLAAANASIDPVTLSLIMSAYLRSKQHQSAIRVFEASTGFSGDGSTRPCQTVLRAQEGGGQIVPSESALNLITGTLLMQSHAYNGNLESVCRVLAALEGRSGAVYGSLESAPWPWTGHYFGSIQPDTIAYNVVLAAAEKVGGRGALTTALDVFDSMEEPNHSVVAPSSRPVKDAVSYNTVISLLCNAGQYGQAFGLFDRMKQVGLRPDKYTYTPLIKACLHEGDVQELLYDMKERGIAADVVTYNTMIRSLCENRQLTQATKLVTEMEQAGISPDSRTYGLLMNGLLRANMASSCLVLFESASSSIRTSSIVENVHIYTTAITAASKLGDPERALEIVSKMTANGVKPNLKTWTALVGACLAGNQPDLAVQLYEKIDRPDGYAMHQGIRSYCGNGQPQRAFELVKTQKRWKRLMSGKEMMRSYQEILHTALQQNDLDLARALWMDLLDKNYIPSKAMIETIVEAFRVGGRRSQLIVADPRLNQERFRYLLFAIDALERHNLPIEGSLYAATLTLASMVGGDTRKIGNYLSQAKVESGSLKKVMTLDGSQAPAPSKLVRGWESVLDDWSVMEDVLSKQLPTLQVRTASKDLRRILRAEQLVSFHSRRTSNSKPSVAP